MPNLGAPQLAFLKNAMEPKPVASANPTSLPSPGSASAASAPPASGAAVPPRQKKPHKTVRKPRVPTIDEEEEEAEVDDDREDNAWDSARKRAYAEYTHADYDMGEDWSNQLDRDGNYREEAPEPRRIRGERYRRTEREADTQQQQHYPHSREQWNSGSYHPDTRSPYPHRPQDHRRREDQYRDPYLDGEQDRPQHNPQDSSQGRPYPPRRTGLPQWDARMDENRRDGKGGGKDGQKGKGKGKFQYRLPDGANLNRVVGLLVAEQKHTSSILKEIVRSEFHIMEVHDPPLVLAFDAVRKEWQSAIPATGTHPVGDLSQLMWGILTVKITNITGDNGIFNDNRALVDLARAWNVDNGGIVEGFKSLGHRPIKAGPPNTPWLFNLKLSYKNPAQQVFRAHLLDSPASLDKLGIVIRTDNTPTRDSERQLSGIKLY
jgi:hypothetical protein